MGEGGTWVEVQKDGVADLLAAGVGEGVAGVVGGWGVEDGVHLASVFDAHAGSE